MNKAIVVILSFLFAACSQNAVGTDPEIPDPPRLVNDFAEILDSSAENALEQKLVAYNDSTTTQIAIVTRKELGGVPAMKYATEMAKNWGVGQKDVNNGILILVSMSNPKEMAIAAGHGIESIISNAQVQAIVDNEVIPNFRESKYYEGLDQATSALIFLLRGKFKNQKN